MRAHHSLLLWAFKHNVSPLSASIAHELVVKWLPTTFDSFDVLVAWAMACKFEETDWEHDMIGFDQISRACNIVASHSTLVERERLLLQRIGFVVPFKTPIRRIFEGLSNTKLTKSWLYLILYLECDHLLNIEDWQKLIQSHNDGIIHPLFLHTLHGMIPTQMLNRLDPPSPKRLTCKKRKLDQYAAAAMMLEC